MAAQEVAHAEGAGEGEVPCDRDVLLLEAGVGERVEQVVDAGEIEDLSGGGGLLDQR